MINTALHEDKIFENVDFSEKALSKREFINCVFTKCNFSKSDLSNNDFTDCNFKDCNLSLAILNNTGLKNVKFENCKIVGVDFNVCANFLFSVNFQNCHLDYSSFFQKKMKSANFINCSLKDVDFAEADLSKVNFNNCDLQNAAFNRTILEKTDFRTAINYSFDPEINKIKKAKFSFSGLPGLLSKFDIEIE